jgi:transcription initiation factor IIE alpha subunit
MPEEESILLDCPKCGIKITVPVSACREGEHSRCPICNADVSFHYSDQELKGLVEKIKRQQQRELYKQFPMTFGEL